MTMLTIPRCRAAVSEDAAARKRREVRNFFPQFQLDKLDERHCVESRNQAEIFSYTLQITRSIQVN